MKPRKINNWKVITGSLLIALSPAGFILIANLPLKACIDESSSAPLLCSFFFGDLLAHPHMLTGLGLSWRLWFIGAVVTVTMIIIGFLLMLAGGPRRAK